MNTEEQSQIYQVLYTRREEITQAWQALMTELLPTATEIAELPTVLQEATEQLLKLLVAEPFNAEPVQQVGKMLEKMDNLQPDALQQICDVLARQFIGGLTTDQIALIYPRVVSLIGALCSAFFIARAERAKAFDMSAMSTMGHDLKTPINAITGFSRVILKGIDGPITEFQQQDLTSIYDAGQRLLNMIDEVFRTAKSDAARTNIYAANFDMADLLGDVLRTSQPVLARRQNALMICCTGELGTMNVDASMMRWIVLGLLYYASRLISNGTVSLEVSREKIEEKEWLLIEIRGKKAEQEAQEQKPNPLSHVQEGMDVAFVTSKRFCEQLGGILTQERDKDNHIKLSVRLPAA